MRRGICGSGALVAVLAFMGCGSTAGKEKEYVREANAICAAADKRLDELPRPSALGQVAKVAKREVEIRKEVIAQLGELTPPVDFAHAVEKAAEDKNRKELRKIREEAKTEFGVEAQRAIAAGMHACAEL